jgi:hypothetical protein
MSLTPWHDPPVRRTLTIPFDLPAYWTPEQALAVVELLDDLRERITAHYAFPLTEALRERQDHDAPGEDDGADDDLPF